MYSFKHTQSKFLGIFFDWFLTLFTWLTLVFLIFSYQVMAAPGKDFSHGIAVDYIQGEGDVKGIKLAYQYHVDWLETYSEKLSMHFESSVNFWEYGKENHHDTNFVLAVSPVFTYPISTVYGKQLYVEFGIGVSLLDDTIFAGKNVSTHYQFEDRLGLVTYMGKNNNQRLALRYFHYSNAGFKSPNPGLDFVALSYSHLF